MLFPGRNASSTVEIRFVRAIFSWPEHYTLEKVFSYCDELRYYKFLIRLTGLLFFNMTKNFEFVVPSLVEREMSWDSAWDILASVESSFFSQHSYCILLCIMRTHLFGPNFQEKKFHFNFLTQCFIYFYSDICVCFFIWRNFSISFWTFYGTRNFM